MLLFYFCVQRLRHRQHQLLRQQPQPSDRSLKFKQSTFLMRRSIVKRIIAQIHSTTKVSDNIGVYYSWRVIIISLEYQVSYCKAMKRSHVFNIWNWMEQNCLCVPGTRYQSNLNEIDKSEQKSQVDGSSKVIEWSTKDESHAASKCFFADDHFLFIFLWFSVFFDLLKRSLFAFIWMSNQSSF